MERISASDFLRPKEAPSRDKAYTRLREWMPNLVKVIMYNSNPPEYALEVDLDGVKRNIVVGEIANLTNQKRFRDIYLSHTRIALTRLSQNDYDDQMIPAFAQAWEIVEVAETSELDELRGWLDKYLEDYRIGLSDDDAELNRSLQSEQPIEWDGDICININNLSRWMATHRQVVISQHKLAHILRRQGCDNRVLPVTTPDGLRRRRHYWVIPRNLLDGYDQIILQVREIRQAKNNRVKSGNIFGPS